MSAPGAQVEGLGGPLAPSGVCRGGVARELALPETADRILYVTEERDSNCGVEGVDLRVGRRG
eukprot:3105831-Lingulodinium_polyedra.AAC.1